MARIKTIKRQAIQDETLHNIGVETDESYVANGVVVHNCKSYVVPILKKTNPNPKIDPRGLTPTSKSAFNAINLKEKMQGES